MEESELQARLEQARLRVRGQYDQLRRLRRRAKESQARASSGRDRAVSAALRAQGHPAAEPPVPTHPPDWLGRPRQT